MKLNQNISTAKHNIYQHFPLKATSITKKHSSSKGRHSMAECILNDVSAASLHSPDNLLGIWCTAWKCFRKSESVNSLITNLTSEGSAVHPSGEPYLTFLLGWAQHLYVQQIIFFWDWKMMYMFQTFYSSNSSRNITKFWGLIYLNSRQCNLSEW